MKLLLTLGLALVTAFSAYAEKPLDLNAVCTELLQRHDRHTST